MPGGTSIEIGGGATALPEAVLRFLPVTVASAIGGTTGCAG